MADVQGMWLQPPTEDAPDVMTERYECPTCRSVWGPIANKGAARVSLVVWCCGLMIELVPPAHIDGCQGDAK